MPILWDWFSTDPNRNNANIHAFLKHSKTPVVFETKPRTHVEKPMDYFKWSYFFLITWTFHHMLFIFYILHRLKNENRTRATVFYSGHSIMRMTYTKSGEFREKQRWLRVLFKMTYWKRFLKLYMFINSATPRRQAGRLLPTTWKECYLEGLPDP